MKINCCNKTVRPFSFMPAKQGAPGEGQDEGTKNQTVALFDTLSPALSRREREFIGQQ
jgi:hypothetical protein